MKLKEKEFEELFTVEEVSNLFKLSRGSIRNLIKKGHITAIRIGKQYRIPKSVIKSYYTQIYIQNKTFGMLKENNSICDGAEYVEKIRNNSRRIEETLEELKKWEE